MRRPAWRTTSTAGTGDNEAENPHVLGECMVDCRESWTVRKKVTRRLGTASMYVCRMRLLRLHPIPLPTSSFPCSNILKPQHLTSLQRRKPILAAVLFAWSICHPLSLVAGSILKVQQTLLRKHRPWYCTEYFLFRRHHNPSTLHAPQSCIRPFRSGAS